MTFTHESDFEAALVELLTHKGWEKTILLNPTEQDLVNNWAGILFENNRGIDRLGNVPLTDGEMHQILEQITTLRTPLRLNGFINGKTVAITRDNPADTLHFGKEVSLKIYDRREIAAGQSRYQIVQQPRFSTPSALTSDRRGDVMLLINGMPVIHIELKRSGVSVTQACHQIEKYQGEGVFSGLFALVQIFVAMEPAETLYFANPGPDGRFNKDFFFHWADFNNEPVDDWAAIADKLLSIPMAHQMIGFYTVADGTDGVLKVMRSYQYYAANALSDRVAKVDWKDHHGRGGYVWHTTGSGKTMTSFKSAQLIAHSQDADKVVFLMDRIELGTQSLQEYRNFAEESEAIQATENTGVLVTKLKSSNPADTLIVTSIQKMSHIHADADGLNAHDLQTMAAKRLVFIVDEAHRSTFGKMLTTIKSTFPKALRFGFTGTPIHDENQKKDSTTATVFGDELHRYSIADGIRDQNVLGFDPYKVLTYRDRDLRLAVALDQAKASAEAEALADPKKAAVFYRFINDVPMAGTTDDSGTAQKGIEDYLSTGQYERREHQDQVVEDIVSNWRVLSRGSKFHALFATSSIAESLEYYRLLKEKAPTLRTTVLFDPTIDNNGNAAWKESGLVEVLQDYNKRYSRSFDIPGHALFKRDVAARLAHKDAYRRLDQQPDQQLDLLIVVDQMLTGFDSKWINTLYLDKVLEYANIIQAFSRTNRLCGPDKPHGTIRYYRFPHTMARNVDRAVKLYSGDKPLGFFVDRLPDNLAKMTARYGEMAVLFARNGVADFSRLPDDLAARGLFAKLFRQFHEALEAALVQGFSWELRYDNFAVKEDDYLVLALRYKELFSDGPGGSGADPDVPYEIDGYLTEIDTGKIDADYMNSQFTKYLKLLAQPSVDPDQLQKTLDEVHRSFAFLTQEEQKFANLFLNDVLRGDVDLSQEMTFREHVVEYQATARTKRIGEVADAFGVDRSKLTTLLNAGLSEANLNAYGRFDELKGSVDWARAQQFLEKAHATKLSAFQVKMKASEYLKSFLLSGGE